MTPLDRPVTNPDIPAGAADAARRFAERWTHRALADLAAGLAHEVNNPLGAIVGITGLLAEREDLPADARADLRTVEQSARRAADMIRQLHAFAQAHQTAVDTDLDLGELVTQTAALADAIYAGEAVSVAASVAGAPWIRAHRGRLQEALLHLARNGVEAMERAGASGVVEIAVSHGGEAVEVCVTDGGDGIAPSDRDRVLRPFVTTKQVGTGAGLGLSTARATLESFGGGLRIAPGPGPTRVVAWLPADRIIRDTGTTASEQFPEAAAATEGARVLCACADEAVGRRVARTLGALGATVELVSTSADAEAAVGRTPTLALALIDAGLDGGAGLEVLARLAAARPALAARSVLLDADGLATGQLPPGAQRLDGPLRTAALLALARDLIPTKGP